MNKILISVGLAVTWGILTPTLTFGFQQTELLGRVVGTDGRPVSGSSVILLPVSGDHSSSAQIDSISYEIAANRHGSFQGSFQFERAVLCATYVATDHGMEALSESFLCSGGKGRLVQGQNNGIVQLGNVPISYNYQLLKLRLVDERNRPFNRERLSDSTIRLRLSSADYFQLVAVTVPRKFISSDESSIRLYLPEGRWHLALSVGEDPRGWSCTYPISVLATHSIVPFEWQARVEYDACRVRRSPAAARARLQEMGIAYTGESLRERIEAGNEEIVRLFLDSGFDIKTIPTEDSPLLLYAVQSSEILRLLVERGADINEVSAQGLSPIMAAVVRGNIGSVRVLIQAGALMDLQDNKGMTALMFAVENDRRDLVEMLLAANVNVLLRTFDGQTAEDIAIEAGHDEIVRIIRQARPNGQAH